MTASVATSDDGISAPGRQQAPFVARERGDVFENLGNWVNEVGHLGIANVKIA